MRSVVEWGADGEAAALEDMSVNHCRFDIFVTEEFLNGADIITALEEVGGKAMTESMGCNTFVYPGKAGGHPDRFLQGSFVDVMPASNSGPGIGRYY